MLKREFIGQVASLSNVTAEQVKSVLAAVMSVSADELAETGETRIPGLASMHVMARTERLARNPKTGVPCMIVPGHTVKSKPAPALIGRVVAGLATQPVQF